MAEHDHGEEGVPVPTLSQCIAIDYQGHKLVLPDDLVTHHDGRPFLKLKTTSRPLVHMLSQGTMGGKYVSMANMPKYQELLDLRNDSYQHEDDQEAVFQGAGQDHDGPPAKKVKRVHLPDIVTLPAGGQDVEFLMEGSRPMKSGLVVAMVPAQLGAIFHVLQKDLANGIEARRPYNKTKKKVEE